MGVREGACRGSLGGRRWERRRGFEVEVRRLMARWIIVGGERGILNAFAGVESIIDSGS